MFQELIEALNRLRDAVDNATERKRAADYLEGIAVGAIAGGLTGASGMPRRTKAQIDELSASGAEDLANEWDAWASLEEEDA